jgi:tetratricopeptide (TPR) repeat protein
MKTYRNFFLFILLINFFSPAFSQTGDAKLLVKEGVALHDSGKYEQAIAKYNDAIKTDPAYSSAYYELGYTLYTTGKAAEAIPYLEKTLKIDPTSAGAYDMLGSIYDDNKEYDKAIDYFKKGIAAAPAYQRLYFNTAISYLNQKKYSDAESYAIEAIKLDPKHASSQRAYAMATFNQNKRGVSLLAWCSFLMLEPETKRSAEAFRYVKYILNYGITKKNEKTVNINISTGDMSPGNLALPMAVLAATTDKKNLTAVDSLQLQLKSVFEIAGTFDMESKDTFYKHYYADYFSKLAASNYMEAFVRLISLSVYRDENLQWFKDNGDKLSAWDAWIAGTKREF